VLRDRPNSRAIRRSDQCRAARCRIRCQTSYDTTPLSFRDPRMGIPEDGSGWLSFQPDSGGSVLPGQPAQFSTGFRIDRGLGFDTPLSLHIRFRGARANPVGSSGARIKLGPCPWSAGWSVPDTVPARHSSLPGVPNGAQQSSGPLACGSSLALRATPPSARTSGGQTAAAFCRPAGARGFLRPPDPGVAPWAKSGRPAGAAEVFLGSPHSHG
jgi:hypothetical protein